MGSTVGTALVIAVLAYLIGSIPSAYIVGRLVAGVDVRVAGEGNVGARNAYHLVGHGWGVAVCLIDAAKGGAVAVALRDRPTWQLMLGGIAVIAGHGFPIWLGFIGGKGVAT
ncbi:MAG TPA: glycerol-3-phosphate acyltransferase, partial [Ilumatobacter sp.]|nr:glycerol-3-phosphate acyltransferase [Ilumatobacter sp.]